MSLMASLSRNVFFPMLMVYERSNVRHHLKELEKSQYLSADRIHELQVERLRRLVQHAYAHCPFYRKRFDEAGFNPRRVQSIADLQCLPVLTKQEIQNNLATLRASNLSKNDLLPDKTGGSTGSPLNFFVNRDRYFSRNASALRHDRWTGWDIGDRSAYLWGHREDLSALQGIKAGLRNSLIDRRIFLDTSSITVERLEQFTKQLRSYKPKIFVAYANAVYLYARFLSETGVKKYWRPSAIITSAELLESYQRELIEQVFECRVFDRYGCREVGIMASECDRHEGLHVCAEAIVVETVLGEKPAGPGKAGRIVITDLLNYASPFIRYQIQDVGGLLENRCSCGRGLPLMTLVGGRVTDFLVTPDGKIVSGASLTIYLVANTPGIAQAQFIQEKKDEIIFRLVPGNGYGPDTMRLLEQQMPEFFGTQVNVRFETVDAIEPSPSGKHRFSISKLDPSQWF